MAALALVASACKKEPPPDPLLARIDAALDKSAAFLLAQQDADGAFRSKQYAAFRDGFATTPLAVSFLLFAPPSPQVDAGYRRGVDFLAGLVDDQGTVREPLEYPVYSAAGALLVIANPRNERHAAKKEALVRFLRARQLTEENGWQPSDPDYGGWGYWPGIPTKPKAGEPRDELLGSTLSSTTWAVGALVLAGVAPSDPSLQAARHFVERCRAADGGFFLTPTNPVANKAGAIPGDGFRGYGSATADATRVLVRLGTPRTDALLVGAERWLLAHVDGAHQSGEFPPEQQFAREGSRYYSAWSQAHALTVLWQKEVGTPPRAWPALFAEELLAAQKPDGSFVNAATDLREDDPLVATPLAAATLALARAVHLGERPTMLKR